MPGGYRKHLEIAEKILTEEYTAKEPLTPLTARVVSMYVQHNRLPVEQLADLISQVHAALDGLGKTIAAPSTPDKPVPAVPIRKSVQNDYIVSLEDGQKFKSLKRHLRTSYGMTPEEYRAKWGLPVDYPMVAPGYAAKRSAMAKSFGLGQRKAEESVAVPAAATKAAKTKRKSSRSKAS
jgi:predicted transcriptional regulator